ncbi:MAG: hypothetical protein ACI4TK_05555 [Agathobacter sp.]
MDKNNQRRETVSPEAYKVTVERMLKNIHDTKQLELIYKYVGRLYIYG